MTGSVKIRIRSGTREIELEGPRADVDALLAAWWTNAEPSADDEEPVVHPKANPKSKRPHRTASAAAPKPDRFDPQPTVNAMREHEDHADWEEKILHQKNNINKIRLVSWFHKQPMTSGEIKAVLEGLGVKIDLATVSNALKANLADFLQDGARKKGAVIRYHLTGKAAKAFAESLNGNG